MLEGAKAVIRAPSQPKQAKVMEALRADDIPLRLKKILHAKVRDVKRLTALLDIAHFNVSALSEAVALLFWDRE